MGWILIIGVVTIFTVVICVTRNAEKKAFNGGICPRCREKLRYFYTTLDGNRGWRCRKCNYTTWCSYDVDDIDDI